MLFCFVLFFLMQKRQPVRLEEPARSLNDGPQLSRQKEKPHGKKKNLTAKRKRLTARRKTSRQKEKDSRQKEKPHGKKNKLTAKEKDSRF